MISVILPTYNEKENIKIIIPKLSKVIADEGIKGEIVIVDDNSPDGTAEVALGMAEKYPVRVHVRKNERGLATAVIKGFELARGDICVVMDADLSHPVNKIPDMIRPIRENKADVSVGSRHISGGSCEGWPLLRRIISSGAGLLAKGVTNLSDPTSGFMAVKKSILNEIKLDPVGWKIVLEVVVKTNSHFTEIPIVFSDRQKGESKLGLKAQLDYLYHLWRLYCYKYPSIIQFIKFCIVGFSGVFVDTAVLASLVELLSFDPRLAAVFAFICAVSWNYIFNRTWTFEESKKTRVINSYFAFISVSLLGLGVRIATMHFLIEYAGMGKGRWYILASISGIIIGTIANFLGSKYFAFSNRFVKKSN